MNKKRILIVTPRLPVPAPGACEKDRFYNMLQLRDLGYEVAVLSKVYPWYDAQSGRTFEREEGISVTTVPYEFTLSMTTGRKFVFWLRHLLPWNWDGAAYEYNHDSIRQTLDKLLDEFKPDLVWFDYTYLWPLYNQVRRRDIPIITRSINFEARHFLEEDGYTLLNFIRSIPKFVSELITIRMSDWLFAITPDEQRTYERWGGRGKTSILVLRGLPKVVGKQVFVHDRAELKVFFMGSTYNVHHNKAALAFIIQKIVPIVARRAPGKFIFHILGKQIPDDLNAHVKGNVKYVGYQNLAEYLPDMDISVTPSLFGAGMQQKVFEPLTLGFPLVTHSRAIAGYDFQDGEHYLAATSPEDFADKIIKLADPLLRRKLSNAAYARSCDLFSQEKVDSQVTGVLKKLINAT